MSECAVEMVRRRQLVPLRFLTSIYLSINERLYYPSEWTRLKSRNTPERGRGMSGHAAGTLWVSNPRIESPCVAERRRSVGGPHVGRFSLAWWWLRAPYGDPILRPRMVPYRVSNPSRRTSGRSARAPSRATSPHPLAGGPQSEVRRGADFLTCPVRPCVLRPRHRPPRLPIYRFTVRPKKAPSPTHRNARSNARGRLLRARGPARAGEPCL